MLLKLFIFLLPVFLFAGEVVWNSDFSDMDKQNIDKIIKEYVDTKYQQEVSDWNANINISSNGLMWQNNEDTIKRFNHNDATEYCGHLALHGFNDWRLPNIDEFKSYISEIQKFNAITDSAYWSSSVSAASSGSAWFSYKLGTSTGPKSNNLDVRCVRNSIYDGSKHKNPYATIKESEKLTSLTNHFIEQNLVANKLTKSKYEKLSVFQERVAKNQKLINEITLKAVSQAYGALYGKPYLDKPLKYNPESEIFYGVIKSSKGGFDKQVSIPVPIAEAENFETNIEKIKTKIIFSYQNEKLILKNITIEESHKKYIAMLSDVDYSNNNAVLTASLSSLEVITKVLPKQTITYNDDIPNLLENSSTRKIDKTKWLFIVGIENYEYTDSVPYSSNSAKEFESVMKRRLGISNENTRTLINTEATSAKIDYNLKDMLRRVRAGDTIYFYYSGHGIPVPTQDNAPYMLAQDMNPSYITDERFKLQNIYKQLSNSKATKIVAFIDSCFSGGSDNQALIKGVAATRIKPKSVTFDTNKMLVISAGSGTQYSNKYDEKGNRLFSYYVMRGLIENNSNTQRLYDYVKSNVQEKSYEMGASYEQVPVYTGNIGLEL